MHYIRKGSSEPEVEKNFERTVSLEDIESRDGLILDVREAADIESRDGLILDVREAAEYAFGHIDGAKSIPMGELESRINELDQEQEIYVICRTGKRSDLAAQLLANNGFTKVYNVLPGMNEWHGKITKEV